LLRLLGTLFWFAPQSHAQPGSCLSFPNASAHEAGLFYLGPFRRIAICGWHSTLKEVAKGSQRLKTVANDFSNR
jgi:hypothetical protein